MGIEPDEPILQTIRRNYSNPQFYVSALADLLHHSVTYLCEKACGHYNMNLQQLLENGIPRRQDVLIGNDEEVTEESWLASQKFICIDQTAIVFAALILLPS
ncbi:MAG: hypothetical protein D6814_11985 [Calditrichaeota bacterium]|nr:MAG: hypothetical protein D6814_11985 [Calditrichota bacterium]